MSTEQIERVVTLNDGIDATWRFPTHGATRLTCFIVGRLTINLDCLFTAQSWLSVLIGQSILPEGHDPLTHGICAQGMGAHMRSIRDTVARTVRGLPTHQDYLAHFWPSSVSA